MNNLDYYIWSFEHNAWWRRYNCGYTTDLKQAGKYAYHNAKQICDNANAYQSIDEPNEEMIHINDHSRIKAVSANSNEHT